MKTRFYCLLAGLLLLFSACQRDPFAWDVDVNAPLLKTRLTFSNLLPDSMLAVNADQSLSLIIEKELFTISTESIAEVPDSLFELAINVAENATVTPGSLLFLRNDKQKLKISPVELNYLKMKRGYLTFELINPFDQAIDIQYKIPAAKKDGVSFNQTVHIPAGSPDAAAYTQKIPMAGYLMDLRGTDLNESNVFNTTLSISIDPNAPETAHTINNKLFIRISFEELEPEYMKGYFGQISSHYGPKTHPLELIDAIQSGTFNLEKCSGRLTIENGIGADMQIRIPYIEAKNSKTQQSVTFQAPFINQTLNITRASDHNGSVTPFVTTYDLGTSNLTQLINVLPDEMVYAADLNFNPLGNVSAGNDFVYSGHPVKANLSLELPLSFSIKNLVLQKNVDYHVNNTLDNVKTATLHLISDNSFPFSATLKIVITDANGTPVMELPCQNGTIAAGLAGEPNECRPARSVTTLQLDEATTAAFLKHNHLLITATLNTAGDDYVQIYDSYGLNLQLTADFDYEIKF